MSEQLPANASNSPRGRSGDEPEEVGTRRRFTPGHQGALVVAVTLFVTSLVVSVLLIQVWHRVQVFELGYQMTELTKERQRLLEEQERLRIEAVVITTTERLDKVAREDLGLRPIAPQQVVHVNPVRTASTTP